MAVPALMHTPVCEGCNWNWKPTWSDLLCHQNSIISWTLSSQNAHAVEDITEQPVTMAQFPSGSCAFLKENLRTYRLPVLSGQQGKVAMVKYVLG